MRAGGFPGNPGGLVVSILKTAGARAPAHQARGRGRRTWRPTERTAGARMVPPGEGNEARGDGRRGVGVSHSTAEAGELSPRDPVEGRGHRQVAPLEGKTANTPRLGPVSTSRQRIAELARQALGMAVAIAWLPGPAGTRRRVAKLSVEEPDAAEPARPDLWGARVSNDPGLPDRSDRLMVDPEGGGDGPDLPVLAEREAPDLGALRGRDHLPSSGRRGATVPGSATGSPGHRPHNGADRAGAPQRQGRGVWRTGGRRGKTDPSRPAGRGRPADGRGDRGVLPDCADGGLWHAAPSAGGPGSGSVPCSRRGHGRTPHRSQRGGRTSGRSSGEGAGPRRRGPRATSDWTAQPKPWHNTTDWLGLSEGEAVTRVRRSSPDPHLRLRPIRTLSETPRQHHGRGYGRCRGCGRTRRAHTRLQNHPEGGFAQAPTVHPLRVDQEPRRIERPH